MPVTIDLTRGPGPAGFAWTSAEGPPLQLHCPPASTSRSPGGAEPVTWCWGELTWRPTNQATRHRKRITGEPRARRQTRDSPRPAPGRQTRSRHRRRGSRQPERGPSGEKRGPVPIPGGPAPSGHGPADGGGRPPSSRWSRSSAAPPRSRWCSATTAARPAGGAARRLRGLARRRQGQHSADGGPRLRAGSQGLQVETSAAWRAADARPSSSGSSSTSWSSRASAALRQAHGPHQRPGQRPAAGGLEEFDDGFTGVVAHLRTGTGLPPRRADPA